MNRRTFHAGRFGSFLRTDCAEQRLWGSRTKTQRRLEVWLIAAWLIILKRTRKISTSMPGNRVTEICHDTCQLRMLISNKVSIQFANGVFYPMLQTKFRPMIYAIWLQKIPPSLSQFYPCQRLPESIFIPKQNPCHPCFHSFM